MDSENRLLPLFPLPLVQFPGAVTSLHIFEPRYRKLLKDVSESDRTFGIIYQRDETQSEVIYTERVRVGCSVEVVAARELPDGRSNIACLGIRRFRVLEYNDDEPYLQAEVEFFDDQPVTTDLSDQVERLSRLLWRVITLGRKIGEVSGVADEEQPEFPSDPQLFSTMVCSYLAIEMDEKQELLELVDSGERMDRADKVLEALITEYQKRAFAQELSKKNGHGSSFPDKE